MIDFRRISGQLYVLYKNGLCISDVPFPRSSLVDELAAVEMTEQELMFIEEVYR